MTKEISEGIGAFYHYYPRLTVVVTARAGERDNVMAVAWHMPVSKNPPLYAVSISPKRFTYELISKSGEFAINFLPASEAELVAAVGGSQGKEIDKFGMFKILKDRSLKIATPILRAAYAAYECKVVNDNLYGDHRLLVGEIIAVHWHEEAFTENTTLNLEKVSPTLYLGSDQYLDISECTVRTLDREACISYLKD
jgi:flavin reductase (DIM6/NTAB) family NADH-FMN oxidoreductase RutF|tara:strand:+ start:614 stop:1201 length:588 start_codon:yes stop_codon:yes gene_type:complete